MQFKERLLYKIDLFFKVVQHKNSKNINKNEYISNEIKYKYYENTAYNCLLKSVSGQPDDIIKIHNCGMEI